MRIWDRDEEEKGGTGGGREAIAIKARVYCASFEERGGRKEEDTPLFPLQYDRTKLNPLETLIIRT